MPQRMRVEAFIAALVGGDYVWALTEFYCSYPTREKGQPLNQTTQLFGGIDLQMQQYRRRAQQPCVHTYLIDGDNVVIHFIHEMLDEQNNPCSIHQLLMQRWTGDRIAEERYFYERAARPALAPTQQSTVKAPGRIRPSAQAATQAGSQQKSRARRAM